MKSMKLSDDSTLLGGPSQPVARGTTLGGPEPELPRYAPGTCIYLGKEALEMLGMDDLPDPGEVMMLHARVVVISETEGMNDRSISLQITDMELGESDEKAEGKSIVYMEDN